MTFQKLSKNLNNYTITNKKSFVEDILLNEFVDKVFDFAYGMTFGFGAFIKHPNELFSAGFSVKNIGFTFKDYTTSSKSMLPINVQAGISYKLKYAPFRFSVLGQQLNKWNIVFKNFVNSY
jgi:hypothetical protein